MKDLLAQTSINIGNLRGTGPLGLEGEEASTGPRTFSGVISTIIGVMTIVAGIWFLFLLITGAYSWMSAGGDKGALEAARKKMINGIIGLVIVIASVFIVDLTGNLFGFEFIRNPAEFINEVAP